MELLEALCLLPGVSSHEDAVRSRILQEGAPYADAVQTDALGNVIFLKGTTEKPVLMFAAHMDEVGLMVSGYTDEGCIRVKPVGEFDRRSLIGKPVLVGDGLLPGVVGIKAVHLVSKEERKVTPKWKDLYVDIGAHDRAEAERLTALGDVACFQRSFASFGRDYWKGSSLDTRWGCAALLELMKQEVPCPCAFVFTAQLQVGCRGIYGAGFALTPEIAVVLDRCDCTYGSEKSEDAVCGKGICLPYKAGGMLADRALHDAVRRQLAAAGIPVQTQTVSTDASDSAPLQVTKQGIRTLSVQLPVRYPDAPATVCRKADYAHAAAACREILTVLGEQVNGREHK